MLWPQEHPRTFCSGVVRRGGGLARVGELRGFLWERNATDRGRIGMERARAGGWSSTLKWGDRSIVPCLVPGPGEEPTRDGR